MEIIQYLITSFLITLFVTPVVIQFFHRKNLTDLPGKRKVHKVVTPSMGGVVIFLGVIISLLMWFPLQGFIHYRYLLMALGIIFLIGFRDDFMPLKPIYKILGQLLAGTLVIFLMQIKLQSFYGLFGLGLLPEPLAIGLTLFVMVVITNSFNLIDGLDGLAGTISTISLVFFGGWFYLVEVPHLAYLCFAFAGGVLAFLRFNWEPSRLFMGDTGALLLGFFFSIMAIRFVNLNYELDPSHPYRFEANISAAMCVILIPLFDTLRIFILRVMQRRSPFSPDKGHLHHVFLRLGLGHGATTLVLGSIQLAFIGLSIAMKDFTDTLVLPILVVSCVLISWAMHMLLKRLPRQRPPVNSGKQAGPYA
jgi:UDP-GlcNAc:undecaprenyl-phosphate/decaprenyl-phosphate GlcNAc-1-phosphate transferase